MEETHRYGGSEKERSLKCCVWFVVGGWNKLFDPVHSDWLNYGGGVSHVIVKQMSL